MNNLLFLIAGITFCSNACGQNTDSAKLYFQKGIVEKEAKHFLVASKNFDKAIGFDPKYKEAYLEDGYANLAMRKTDVAKGHFAKVYQLDPANKDAIKELTQLYYDYNQFPKAIEFANKCTGCENADRIIAMSSYKMEDYATAIKGLQNVVAKSPADAEATYTIGRCYVDMELYTKAVPFYEKAVGLDTTKNNWLNELGMLYYTLTDFKNAKTYFIKASEHGYPVSNDFNENLGYAYIYSGESEKGEKLLLDILAKKPGDTDILRDIAEAYYQQRMYDKSLDYCKKLLTLDAKDAKALYQAGMCFQKKGQKEKGQSMCDEAIKIDPSLSSHRQKLDSGVGL